MSETVLPTTQTTSPTTPHCRHFSPRWSALRAPHHPEPRPHHPEPRPHRHQTGGIAPIEPRHADDHTGRMLLMVQNPHHYPWRHAPSLASRSLTGAGLPGGAPINAGRVTPTETGQGHGRTMYEQTRARRTRCRCLFRAGLLLLLAALPTHGILANCQP